MDLFVVLEEFIVVFWAIKLSLQGMSRFQKFVQRSNLLEFIIWTLGGRWSERDMFPWHMSLTWDSDMWQWLAEVRCGGMGDGVSKSRPFFQRPWRDRAIGLISCNTYAAAYVAKNNESTHKQHSTVSSNKHVHTIKLWDLPVTNLEDAWGLL